MAKPSASIRDILKRLGDAQRQARQANIQRFKDIVGERVEGAPPGTFRGGLLENVGREQRELIGERSVQAGARAEQDLISRGLASTTIRPSIQRGIASDRARQERALTEQTSRLRAGVIERREDTGPDPALFANLARQAEAAGSTNRIQARIPGRAVPSGGPAGSGGGGGRSSFGERAPGQPTIQGGVKTFGTTGTGRAPDVVVGAGGQTKSTLKRPRRSIFGGLITSRTSREGRQFSLMAGF